MDNKFLQKINSFEDTQNVDTLILMVRDHSLTDDKRSYIRAAINRILIEYPDVRTI